MKEIPVYLFLGFLESGKTKFVQETLEDQRFESEGNTLVLVLEEGEEEYDSSRFSFENCYLEYLDDDNFNLDTVKQLAKKYKPDRVVVEYNGMYELQRFFEAMPDGWLIYQVMTFFDSATFLQYNKNMRQLVFDKIQYADMVVFNRFQANYSKEEFHKVIRAISRRPDIVYEYANGQVEYDDIVDPLPYDINADVIEIKDTDYAFFYRDLMEDMQKYQGKTVKFKGIVATDKRLKKGTFVIGRHIMTCCEADITYSGVVCLFDGKLPLNTRDWVKITANISIEYHSVYEQEGPVLHVNKINYCEAPEQELATFY